MNSKFPRRKLSDQKADAQLWAAQYVVNLQEAICEASQSPVDQLLHAQALLSFLSVRERQLKELVAVHDAANEEANASR